MENYLEIVDRYKIPLALGLIGVVLIIGGMVATNSSQKSTNYPKESIVESNKVIKVDISGAVKNPGVYDLDSHSRIEEVISKAGGFKSDANQEFISKSLNKAQKISDGMKIYIPYEGDVQGMVSGVATSAQININTASQSELETLSGIGPVSASKIISGRPYQSLDELVGKKIIGKATFEKIKSQITLY